MAQDPILSIPKPLHKDGKQYYDSSAILTVGIICRANGTDLDSLAAKLGVSRTVMSLVLRGIDPCPPGFPGKMERLLRSYLGLPQAESKTETDSGGSAVSA